ncbi:MAG: hypothetical protein AABX72_01505 [Nanoarchaeota archaeon]
MKKRWMTITLLVLVVSFITGCFQETSTKQLVPDDQEMISPDTTLPPTDEVIEDIDIYESEDVDLDEFDDLTKDFEGL